MYNLPADTYDIRTVDRIEAERAKSQARLALLEEVERRAIAIEQEEIRQRELAEQRLAQNLMHSWSRRNNVAAVRQQQFEMTQQGLQQADVQAGWDAQAKKDQMFSRLREQAIKSMDATDLQVGGERAIVAKTYELAYKEALASGDTEAAKEWQRRANIGQGIESPTEQDYATGVVKRPEGLQLPGQPIEATEPSRAEQVAGGIVEGTKAVVGGVYKHTAQDWSALVNAAQMAAKKDESELDENERRFLALFREYGNAMNRATGGSYWTGAVAEPTTERSVGAIEPEMYEAYESLGTGRKLVGEATYPGWFLLGEAGSFSGLKAALGGVVGKDALGTAAIQITKGILTPGAVAEQGISKLFGLAFKGLGKAAAPIINRLTKKAVANEQAAEKVLPVLDKIAKNEALDADDIARAADFDDELGKVVKEVVPEPKPAASIETQATEGIAEGDTITDGLVNARVIGEGAIKFGKKDIPAYKVQIVSGKEQGQISAIAVEDAKLVSKATEQAEKVIIGGGTPYDPMKGLFETEPTEQAVKRLFPESNISKVTQAAGKVPFGEEVVRALNPTLTPRESIAARTVQEHGAIANDLVYRIASGRKAMLGNQFKALFPESDAVKHFQIDEQAIQHAFTPKEEGASMAIVDVLEHPNNYNLDEPAKQFIQMWRNVHKQAIAALESRGIKINKKFYEEGAGYFPRMVRAAHGEEAAFPSVKFKKPRSWSTQIEGIYNEIGYTQDPVHNINAFIDETYRIIAAHDLKQAVDAVGRTAKDAVPISIRMARDEAVKRYRTLSKALQAAQRAKRGEKLPAPTIKSIASVDADLASQLEKGTFDTKALKSVVDDAKRAAAMARLNYTRALQKATGPRLGSFERGTIHPAFKGQWFPEETARVLDDLAPKGASAGWRKVQSVNEALRTVKANFDFSPGTIQGLNVLARFPVKWGKTTALAFDWLFHPKNAPKWFAKHGDILSRHPDIVQGTHEYYAGKAALEKLPKVGKTIGKAMEPFEKYFTNWGDAARVMAAEALEPSFVKTGTPEALGTYVNRLTGVMDTRALGVSGKQRAFESLVLFAPRYTRACIAYIGTALEGGVSGAEARKTLALLFGAGTAFWMGMQKATGEQPSWPNSANFWTVKMGNRRVGMGGFMYSFARLLADVYQSVTSEGGNEPLDFTKFDRTNPIVNFLSKRTSVIGQMGRGLLNQTDFLGYPLEDFNEWAHWFIVEGLLPIGLQEQIPGPNEEAPTNRLGLAAAEAFGLRTFPTNEYYELADKYAMATYGKKWNDLSKPTSSGTYTQSAEQKALLAKYPDLKAAYEEQKPRASERWKAQHGLQGDEDVKRDYWAQKLYGKNYKELPDAYRKKVDESIERG